MFFSQKIIQNARKVIVAAIKKMTAIILYHVNVLLGTLIDGDM